MATTPATAPSTDATVSRRGFLMKLGILFDALAAAVVSVPILRYLASSITRNPRQHYLSWVALGPVGQFPEGETRLATFKTPM